MNTTTNNTIKTNKLTTAELTALHGATLAAMNAEARTARTLANISRRAQTLFTDGGYRAEAFASDFFHVFGPEGQHYTVLCGAVAGFNCDCKAFSEYGTCKHLEAVDMMKSDAAQADAFDAQDAFDPYALRF